MHRFHWTNHSNLSVNLNDRHFYGKGISPDKPYKNFPAVAVAHAARGVVISAVLRSDFLAIGLGSGLLRVELIAAELAPLLLFTLFFFPSLFEEAFFRGILIPRETIKHGRRRIILTITWSTLLFVLWHPLNAVTFNRSAIPIFLDPAFLLIVAALGITSGYGYVVLKSIWVPVLIHWATVVVWVFFFGGRNLVLES